MILNKKQPGAALLITLLLVSIFGAVAVIGVRSIIMNNTMTLSTADAMVAEAASKAGLEYGLLAFKNNNDIAGSTKCFLVNIETGNNPDATSAPAICPARGQFNERTAVVKISKNASNKIMVESTGYFGKVAKYHKLTEQ